MIQARLVSSKTLSVIATNGKTRLAYLRNHRLPPDVLPTAPPDSPAGGEITIRAASARGLMFRKILLEEFAPVQAKPALTAQLTAMFTTAEQNNAATLFHIQWQNAEGFVLIAGGKIPIRQAVLMTGDLFDEGRSAFDQILGWAEKDCHVAVHRGDIKSQAWLEMHLGILFEWACNRILEQYGKLTGVVMTQTILRAVSITAAKNDWDIDTLHNAVIDRTIFPSAASAGAAYRRIFSLIRRNMQPIIGPQLTESVFSNVANSTREIYRVLAEVYELY